MPGPREIVTSRLTLRPPSSGDRALWVRLHRDPALYPHAPWAMPATDEEASAEFDDCLRRWTETGFDHGVVEESSSRAGIGVGGLRRRDLEGEDVLDLSYRLALDTRGRGLGREAARGWVAHAIEWLPDLPVVARARGLDEPSVRAALAAGLEPAGEVEEGPSGSAPSTVLRAPRTSARDWLDEETRESLLDLWCAVNDDGGAVGFLPGAPRSDVAQALAVHEEGMADGTTTLVLLRRPDGRVVGAGFWVADRNPMLGHTRTAYRVMTDPGLRGRNLGRLLMGAMHRAAREQGVEVALLDVRSGLGTTRFYETCGYVEVGRLPGVIRVAPGDDRDSVVMARRLDGRPMVADGRA